MTFSTAHILLTAAIAAVLVFVASTVSTSQALWRPDDEHVAETDPQRFASYAASQRG